MGISRAILRMKEGVHRAGVGRVAAGLEGQLRSASVPSPLRWAARRLAGFIGRDGPAADAVVSLDAAIEAQAGRARSELAGSGGVCPFSRTGQGAVGGSDASGVDASSFEASSFEAPALEVVHTADAEVDRASGLGREPVEGEHSDAGAAVGAPVPTAPAAPGATAELQLAAQPAAEPAVTGAARRFSSAKAAAKPATAVLLGSSRSAPKARSAKSAEPGAGGLSATPVPRASSTPTAGAGQGKKAQTTSEKDAVKVAAGPVSSKTPARSVASSGRSAAKRPVAKAAKKRD